MAVREQILQEVVSVRPGLAIGISNAGHLYTHLFTILYATAGAASAEGVRSDTGSLYLMFAGAAVLAAMGASLLPKPRVQPA